MLEVEYVDFLKRAASGCVTGRISEWPQFVPACQYAAQELEKIDKLKLLVSEQHESKEQFISRAREVIYYG